jgi:hypothetical protein
MNEACDSHEFCWIGSNSFGKRAMSVHYISLGLGCTGSSVVSYREATFCGIGCNTANFNMYRVICSGFNGTPSGGDSGVIDVALKYLSTEPPT